jgi:hypothetical protein
MVHTGRQHRHFGHYYKCMIITRKKIKFHVMWSRKMIYNQSAIPDLNVYIHTCIGLGCNCLDTWDLFWATKHFSHVFEFFEAMINICHGRQCYHLTFIAWRRILVKQSTTWLGGKIKEEKPQNSINPKVVLHWKSFIKVTYCWDWNLFMLYCSSRSSL